MNSWGEVRVSDALSKSRYSVGRIGRGAYQQAGKVAVVDQGQDLIAGFTDDVDAAYSGPLPVVIFGDHTRAIKYVDFPFVRGADGTQVLVPDRDVLDPEFLYYALMSRPLPSRGYNRHFKLLKELSVPQPPLAEQRTIARILRTVQRAKEQTDEVIAVAREVELSLSAHLFPQFQDGGNTSDWKRLGDCGAWLSGGTPSTSIPQYWGGDIPWITASSLTTFHLRDSVRRVTQEGLENGTRLVPEGSTIFVVRGMSLRKEFRVGYATRPMAFGQDCKAIQPHPDIDPLYLALAVRSRDRDVLQLVDRAGHGTGRLQTEAIKDVQIPVPPRQRQKEIVEAMVPAGAKVGAERRYLESLQGLFESLLHDLMSGELRLSDWDEAA